MWGRWDVSRAGWASNQWGGGGAGALCSSWMWPYPASSNARLSYRGTPVALKGASSWGVGEGLAACLLPALLLPHPIPPRLCHFQGTTPLALHSHPQLPALRLWFLSSVWAHLALLPSTIAVVSSPLVICLLCSPAWLWIYILCYCFQCCFFSFSAFIAAVFTWRASPPLPFFLSFFLATPISWWS